MDKDDWVKRIIDLTAAKCVGPPPAPVQKTTGDRTHAGFLSGLAGKLVTNYNIVISLGTVYSQTPILVVEGGLIVKCIDDRVHIRVDDYYTRPTDIRFKPQSLLLSKPDVEAKLIDIIIHRITLYRAWDQSREEVAGEVFKTEEYRKWTAENPEDSEELGRDIIREHLERPVLNWS